MVSGSPSRLRNQEEAGVEENRMARAKCGRAPRQPDRAEGGIIIMPLSNLLRLAQYSDNQSVRGAGALARVGPPGPTAEPVGTTGRIVKHWAYLQKEIAHENSPYRSEERRVGKECRSRGPPLD